MTGVVVADARPLIGLARIDRLAVLKQTRCRFLLIDERRGREVARRRGVPVVGLAGALLAAKRSGLLESLEPVLSDLSQQGYRLADGLVAEVLRLAGEAAQQG